MKEALTVVRRSNTRRGDGQEKHCLAISLGVTVSLGGSHDSFGIPIPDRISRAPV
jgi:hypothetical protein